MPEQLSIPVSDISPSLVSRCLVSIDKWSHAIFNKQDIEVYVLRLDKIHPEISGNKWFKLKYHLEKAKARNKTKLISFGGPYSNHLLAVAASAGSLGFSTAAYIRGERPAIFSKTLRDAEEHGMELRFLSRAQYNGKKNAFPDNEDLHDPDGYVIPEGGADQTGVQGAEEILRMVSQIEEYTHICVAMGTGCTLAGIANSAGEHQKIIGIPVLKGTSGFQPLNGSWLADPARLGNIEVIHGDHWGGYAKKSPLLIDFMNQVYQDSGVPTDFIYTGKLFFSIVRMAGIHAFLPGSKVLVIHSGGLQGNRSLMPGLLQY